MRASAPTGFRHPRKGRHTGRPLRTPGERVAAAQPLAARPLTDAAYPLRVKRNARKEKLVKCVLAPRRRRHHPARDGSCKLAEDHSVPEGRAKSALAPIRRPPYSAEARACRSASRRFFSLDRAIAQPLAALPPYGCGIPLAGTARFSFGKTKYGAPAAPRAVGRGGARERAQFSPQAETELSGLCDDDNGGCIAPPSAWLFPRVQWDALPYLFRQKYGPHSASWVWAYVQVKSLSTTYQSAPGTAPASDGRGASSSAVTGRTRGSPSGGYSL